MSAINCKLTFDQSKRFLICRLCGLETHFNAPGELIEPPTCVGGNVRMCTIEWVAIANTGFVFECCRKCLRIYDQLSLYECPQREYREGDEPMLKCYRGEETRCGCVDFETRSKIVICKQNAYFRRFRHHVLDVCLSELIDEVLHTDREEGTYYNRLEKMTLWGLCGATLLRKMNERKKFIAKISPRLKVRVLSHR